MVSGWIIGGGLALAGILYLRSRKTAAPDCAAQCKAKTAGLGGALGVPGGDALASVECVAACAVKSWLEGTPFTCPDGYEDVIDMRDGTALHVPVGNVITGYGGDPNEFLHQADFDGGRVSNGHPHRCVKKSASPPPPLAGAGPASSATFGCPPPKWATWKNGAWVRLAAGETQNLGPCAPASTSSPPSRARAQGITPALSTQFGSHTL